MTIASLAVQVGWITILLNVTANILTPHPNLRPAVLELFRSIPAEADSERLVLAREEDLGGYRDHSRRSAGVALGLCEHAVQVSASTPGGVGSGVRDVATAEAVLTFYEYECSSVLPLLPPKLDTHRGHGSHAPRTIGVGSTDL